jgi:hypothetical protein
MHNDEPDGIGLRQSVRAGTVLLDTPDDELASVFEQLRRSLENLQSNHTHVDGINGAIREAHAALDNVLYRHASAQQYAAL